MKKIFLLIISLVICSAIAFAENPSTTYMTVRIVNTGPSLASTDIIVTPDPADPGNTMTVTADVTDSNGVPDDIASVVATYIGAGGESETVSLLYNETSSLYQNNSYTLPNNATAGEWTVSVNVTDNGGISVVNSTTFTVNTVISLELTQTPIDFGNTSTDVSDRKADDGTPGSGYSGGTVKGFPLLIENKGNVNQTYNITGQDLVGQTDPGYNISVGSIKYDTDSDVAGASALSTSESTISINNLIGSLEEVYFWITISGVLPEQEYRGNVTITGSQS